jgi:hypothetical protein
MTYVLAGYAATVGGLGAYAAWVVRRARALDRLRQGG